MGLLTDPSGLHGRPFQKLVANQGSICLILYLASIAWYCLLAHEQINSGTYLSENALLPGLVTVGCDASGSARLAAELERERAGGGPTAARAWLKGRLRRAGLEVYEHNFTLNYPLGAGAVYTGRNVYGIIRGGGAATESMVLSAPYRDPGGGQPSSDPALALLVSIAACFRKQKYWAKDIILLATEHEQLGVQAWLEAYHGTPCGAPGVLESGELDARGGSIQAAVNLEVSSTRLSSLDVKLLGLNGQLPNLDLANLVHRIGAKEKIPHTFAGRGGRRGSWLSSLETMTWMVLNQAGGVPDGNHGLFHRFGIEAVTLEGHSDPGLPQPVSLEHVARVIEGIFRSINNLLERFHQSYFFYLLVDTDRFVSIGLYMPCVGLLVGALFIKAFAVYLSLKSVLQSVVGEVTESQEPVELGLNSVGLGVVLLGSYAVGLLASNSGLFFTKALSSLKTDDSLFLGTCILSAATLALPPILLKKLSCEGASEWVCLHIATLVHLGTLLAAVAMHNFSLAFVVALAVVPPALLLNTAANGLFKKWLVVCIHPLSLLVLSVAVAASIQFPPSEILYRTWVGSKQSLVLGLVDSLVYSSWSHTVVTLFYLPNWCMLWVLAHSKSTCLDIPLEKSPKKIKSD